MSNDYADNAAGTSSPVAASPGGGGPYQTATSTSREDIRRKRELEEARKSGLIPAEKDEEGRDINPHIPQYIAKAPWYLNNEGPSLKHQRRSDLGTDAADAVAKINHWYTRGVKEDTEAEQHKKFKKNACLNCGATTHKELECVERPRAKGAKWTGRDIAQDEYIPTETIDSFEAKRDRWGGYDPQAYGLVIEEFNAIEEEERKRKTNDGKTDEGKTDDGKTNEGKTNEGKVNEDKAVTNDEPPSLSASPPPTTKQQQRRDETLVSGLDSDEENNDGDDAGQGDGAKIGDFDASNAPVGTKDDRTRTTTRNLRIREDTAKYLVNLDLESAFYDPKTRSMRDDPTQGLPQSVREKLLYRGDNAVRATGQAAMPRDLEVFAWESYTRGKSMNSQTNPTLLEISFKESQKRKKNTIDEKKKHLLAKYGGAEHLNTPADVRHAQLDVFVQYDSSGTGKPTVKSKYEEDVTPLNHSSVWGSYYNEGKWGYACCKEIRRHELCTAAENI